MKVVAEAVARKHLPIFVVSAPPNSEPAVYCECRACHWQFWVDPCGELNLVEKNGRLKEKCPCCGTENP